MSICHDGSSPTNAHERTKAFGTSPSRSAVFSSISITAAAPSVSGELLPAVTVPYLRSNTGRSDESFSIVVSARGMPSRVAVSVYAAGPGAT